MISTNDVTVKHVSEEKTANALLNRYESMTIEINAIHQVLHDAGLWVIARDDGFAPAITVTGKGDENRGKHKKFSDLKALYAFAFNYIKTGEWE